MIDIGVASPSAHGQATISTATEFTSACDQRGSGPQRPQATNVAMATSTTAGTNQADTRSASRWIGARLRCASPTMRTMRASSVSEPTCFASITKPPGPLRVPPVTLAPAAFSTGAASPVIIDSSTALLPSSTTPSTGTFSPGRTRSRSPTATWSSGTSLSAPSRPIRLAVLGASSSSARIARPVAARARSSSTCPSSTSVTITAAAS
jgi:hypothetical protein